MVVLLPKGNGNFCVIALVEVIWNTMSGIINQQIGTAFRFHDVLNGFQKGPGMVTTSLKANLLQQLTDMREEVLYEVFLDLWKYYDTLDRECCMENLFGYRVGPHTE